jgi:COP9 signalosome complex subunit 5
MKSELQPAALKDDGESTEKKKPSLDNRYHFDEAKLNQLRKESPWTKDPKYFTACSLSPSAVMKMMMHCQSGVKKGIDKGGNPIEVMGLLMGRPDHETPKTLVITDAFPLPIEGFETRVIADDQDVVNHMIALGECLERTRKEKFMGWYHSHPFDLGDHSHCFLSQTDLSTQLQWQRAEDPHGNPFVAIVLDPLRSIHCSTPELKAFRAYPPEYNSPVLNQCPDGSIESSEQARLEHWGSCWNRYYELNVEYYMSTTARGILEQLTKDYLWMRTLGSSGGGAAGGSVEQEETKLAERISKNAQQFNIVAGSTGGGDSSSSGSKGMSSASMFGAGRPLQVDPAVAIALEMGDSRVANTIASMTSSTGATSLKSTDEATMNKAVAECVELASQQLDATTLQNAKQSLFSSKSSPHN